MADEKDGTRFASRTPTLVLMDVIQWDYDPQTPYDRALGGTQSAACSFAETLVALGLRVVLFNFSKEPHMVRDVDVRPWNRTSDLAALVKEENVIAVVVCSDVDAACSVKQLLGANAPPTLIWTQHATDQQAVASYESPARLAVVDGHLFVSRWQRDQYLAKYGPSGGFGKGLDPKKCFVMRNGISLAFLEGLNSLKKQQRTTTWAYASIPWRGLSLYPSILKALPHAEEKSEEPHLRAEIFSGMNLYQSTNDPATAKLLNELSATSGVVVHQAVAQPLLARSLEHVDFFLYPNTYAETSCMAVMNAMAAGALVITSDLGALPETMAGFAAELVSAPPGEETAPAAVWASAAAKWLTASAEAKDSLRERARKFALEYYDWKAIVREFLDNTLPAVKKSSWTSLAAFDADMRARGTVDSLKLISAMTADDHLALARAHWARKDPGPMADEYRRYLHHTYDVKVLNEFHRIIEEPPAIPVLLYESAAMIQDALSLRPNDVDLLVNASSSDRKRTILPGVIVRAIAQGQKAVVEYKKQVAAGKIPYEWPIERALFTNLAFWSLSTLDTISPEELRRMTEVFAATTPFDAGVMERVEAARLWADARRKRSEIIPKHKIGYMSADICSHPVGHMVYTILRHHNLEKFEVHVLDHTPDHRLNDPKHRTFILERFRKIPGIIWHPCADFSDEKLACHTAALGLDLLVDLMGHTCGNRLPVLKYIGHSMAGEQVRPVQVSFFGYPATTGMPEMKYKLVDPLMCVSGVERQFTEKMWALREGLQVYEELEPTRTDKIYRERGPRIICCNNFTKLTPDFATACRRILLELGPSAVLCLRYHGITYSLLQAVVVQGICGGHPELAAQLELTVGDGGPAQHLEYYRDVDFALDAFPYNGGITSSECLFMGTPFVTLAGGSYVGMVGESLLRRLGLRELVAADLDEYVKIAVDLARDQTRLRRYHEYIHDRFPKCGLGNGKIFVQGLEADFADIIRLENVSPSREAAHTELPIDARTMSAPHIESKVFDVRLSGFSRSALVAELQQKRATGKFSVIDVGGSMVGWSAPVIDAIVDANPSVVQDSKVRHFVVNLNMPDDWKEVDAYVAAHGKFDFSICTHTLEDVANPKFVCQKLSQISKEGYIAVPSKYQECKKGDYGPQRGYMHHRWIMSVKDGAFVAYPKMSFLEYDARLDALGTLQHSEIADLAFRWRDRIDLRIANADFLGPTPAAVPGIYDDLLQDDLDAAVAKWHQTMN